MCLGTRFYGYTGVMDDIHLYQQIAAAVRQKILDGELKPGDRLPTVRAMADQWECTAGTVQHAYRELADQGLVVARKGQGTRVAESALQPADNVLRRVQLINRAENFLLEVLTAGYPIEEIEAALRIAFDRWKVVSQEQPQVQPSQVLRFAGSHDLALAWLAAQIHEHAPGITIQLGFSGSLSGLMALAEGTAELAGSHLWDAETDTYNAPFVRRLFPGKPMAMVTLAHRQLGWIVPPENPRGFKGIEDLAQPGLRFVNRRSGSGTRVRLDAALRQVGLSPNSIEGYTLEKSTHIQVARLVAEGSADVAFGLGAAAAAYGLSFVPFVEERYDLVMSAELIHHPGVQAMIEILTQKEFHLMLQKLSGYNSRASGSIIKIN